MLKVKVFLLTSKCVYICQYMCCFVIQYIQLLSYSYLIWVLCNVYSIKDKYIFRYHKIMRYRKYLQFILLICLRFICGCMTRIFLSIAAVQLWWSMHWYRLLYLYRLNNPEDKQIPMNIQFIYLQSLKVYLACNLCHSNIEQLTGVNQYVHFYLYNLFNLLFCRWKFRE